MSIPPFLLSFFFSGRAFAHLKVLKVHNFFFMALQGSQLSGEKREKIEKSSKRATTAPSDGLQNRLIRPNIVAPFFGAFFFFIFFKN